MAMGGNVTHCGKQIASWVQFPITTPSFCMFKADDGNQKAV